MKTERNILIAFLLNLFFSIFEFFGGFITGSTAILSDAVHDAGDAISIGISCFLEQKSKKKADEKYTYGYTRYSAIGGLFTTLILMIGSVFMIFHAAERFITPEAIDYSGMIVFALVGVCVNFCAAFFTRNGKSVNQRAVNLHMLEDVLGWVVVLLGAFVMRFTDWVFLDPVMSIAVSLFILFHAIRNLKTILKLFLEQTPKSVNFTEIKAHIEEISGVLKAHHIHIWSLDEQNNLATLHVVCNENTEEIKAEIRKELEKHGIGHVTIETESEGEELSDTECSIQGTTFSPHGHCHHHHHHGHSFR